MFTGTPTPKLGLPQWEPQNHPDFLTDMNEAFKKIDENAQGTGESVEEIAEIQSNIGDLQALTQSLNEDSQQMIGEISAINIALGNLRGETDKIKPIQTQVLGLQEIARRQSDAIQKLIVDTEHVFYRVDARGKYFNGVSTGNSLIQAQEILRIDNMLLLTIVSGDTAGNIIQNSEVCRMSLDDSLTIANAIGFNDSIPDGRDIAAVPLITANKPYRLWGVASFSVHNSLLTLFVLRVNQEEFTDNDKINMGASPATCALQLAHTGGILG